MARRIVPRVDRNTISGCSVSSRTFFPKGEGKAGSGESVVRAVAILGTLTLIGCGGETYVIAPVSGRITVDGEPLSECEIRFQPVAASAGSVNPGPGAFALTDEHGRFSLRTINMKRPGAVPGAVVGAHRVWMTTVREKDASTELGLMTAEKVPPPYRNGNLNFDVPRQGTDQANFDLTSP